MGVADNSVFLGAAFYAMAGDRRHGPDPPEPRPRPAAPFKPDFACGRESAKVIDVAATRATIGV
ncbi:hypothetical protein GCM10009730_08240 [Streptomyces albidochromogenes]